jgi:hypothetical protein
MTNNLERSGTETPCRQATTDNPGLPSLEHGLAPKGDDRGRRWQSSTAPGNPVQTTIDRGQKTFAGLVGRTGPKGQQVGPWR